MRSQFSSRRFQNKIFKTYKRPAIVVVTFGVVGVLLLNLSHAATSSSSIEPENGTLNGATAVTDTTASGGKSVKFGSAGGTTLTCNLNATTANFAAQVSAATAGQVICLASGNYGTWTGTNKAITIAAASGAAPQMKFNFSSSSQNFTLDGMTGMSGTDSGSSNVTIRNSTFTAGSEIDHPTNMVFDSDHWDWNTTGQSKIYVAGKQTGTIANPSVTIKNSTFTNGEADGIHMGATDVNNPYSNGVVILNNTFKNLCDIGQNHTDTIQFDAGASQIRIAGNYVYAAQNCPTQGITDYDSNVSGTVIIENNVVDIPRDWGIEFYAVNAGASLIIRHNTVVWHNNAYSEFNSGTGQIAIDKKSDQSCGPGAVTVIQDNIASPGGSCPFTSTKNISGQTVTYVGGANPTSFAGFLLANGSPGIGAASDGTNIGIN